MSLALKSVLLQLAGFFTGLWGLLCFPPALLFAIYANPPCDPGSGGICPVFGPIGYLVAAVLAAGGVALLYTARKLYGAEHRL